MLPAFASERRHISEETFPQGLKPTISFARLAAQLKLRPFKTYGLLGTDGLLISKSFSATSVALLFFALAAILVAGSALCAQAPVTAQAPVANQASENESSPIAIVPLDSKNPDKAAKVTGALEVTQGKAIIASSGTITSGAETTQVILPHRGVLRVCASTSVKLAADSSVPVGEIPGLMIAMEHGAVEASYATGQNSDILLTPDFRILIGGPGAADVKIRLGEHGDTCVDNAGINAPYVLVSSVFEGGAYRVQPGQRVMFEHGSLHEVVDDEKEPCGCPPAEPKGNEFPLAQSEGLAPLAKPAPSAANAGGTQAVPVEPLVYKSPEQTAAPAAAPAAATPDNAAANPAAKTTPAKKKTGFFGSIGKFFRHFFGAE